MANSMSRLSYLLTVILFATMTGCATHFLRDRDTEITNSTRTIETAHDDAHRAKAYSARGGAYSEKARYSRLQKLIPNDEYERLFQQAITDHDKAVALSPATAEVYFNRAQTYYDRGSLDLIYLTNPYDAKPRNNKWLTAAALDFEKATEINPKDSLAFDRLGLAYDSNNETENAIRAYTKEMALDSRLGKHRLADTYCVMGYQHQLQKDWNAAIAAYRKSITFATADDKTCPVEPVAAIIEIDRMKKDSARGN